MSVAIDRLVKLVLQKKSLDDCTLQELQKVANSYPYYGAIQLLLNSKSGSQPEPRTLLYFPNEPWLHYLVHEKGKARIVDGKKDEVAAAAHLHVFEPAFTAERTVAVAETFSIPEKKEPAPITAVPSDEAKQIASQPIVEIEEKVETQPQSVASPVVPVEYPEQKNDAPETLTEIMIPEKKDPVPSNGNGKGSEPMPVTITPVAELSFEPFHTVDYFASQGIKISEEEKSKDKFGQQLKSFTEWLKSMKKAQAAAAPVNPQSDQKVERMAAHSLAEREVLTEAMAEVWEKQGSPEKAVAIYEKLSLLNPSKSSYFAAKIDHLKKS